jgi:hypothetical protein
MEKDTIKVPNDPIFVNDKNSIFKTNIYAYVFQLYMLYVVSIFSFSFTFYNGARILIENDAESTSPVTTSLYLIVSCSWFIYGILKKDIILIISGIVGIIGSLFVLICLLVVNTW